MFKRLDELETRFQEVQSQLADPATTSRPDELRRLGKLHAELEEVATAYRRYRRAVQEAEAARAMAAEEEDPEMRVLANQEVETQQALAAELEATLRSLLVPKDPNDERDVIVQIQAGEGGDESALFAGDLFKMYGRFAERQGWKLEVLSSNPSDLGGFKDVTFALKGKGAFSRMKHEAGVHRVQRVPETESQGRIHTSAAGVLVFPEAEDVEVEIDPNDIRVDVFRSSGPGGQSVNTTDSAVRLTHKPTGIVVSCQDEKSQLQNRDKAMRILRARLYQAEQERQQAEQAAARKSQVRAVDRSEKIRTYNYPQNRVTDHRVKVSVHNLPEVMAGGIDPFVDALVNQARAGQLAGDPEALVG
ncbi:MAG: peptide chain release factor 1 [Actinomycetota bacterium]